MTERVFTFCLEFSQVILLFIVNDIYSIDVALQNIMLKCYFGFLME